MTRSEQKVFGIGFPKTGTTSLEEALEVLGYSVCKGHWSNNYTYYLLALYVNGDFDELMRMTKYWDAFADGPWGGTELYQKLATEYPNSYFVHTARDAETWYKSLMKMITQFDSDIGSAFKSYHKYRWGSAYYFGKLFQIDSIIDAKEKVISHYNDFNTKARNFFESMPQLNYLHVDLTKTPDWNILCQFLNKGVPKSKFPHLNKAKTANKKRIGYLMPRWPK